MPKKAVVQVSSKQKNRTGRRLGSGRFGYYRTKVIRVPLPLVELVETLVSNFEENIKTPLLPPDHELTIGSMVRKPR